MVIPLITKTNWFHYLIHCYCNFDRNTTLPGIDLTTAVATVLTKSVPGGLLGFEMASTLVPSSISVSCFIPDCSSLYNTCSDSRCQISKLPLSADIIYLNYKTINSILILKNCSEEVIKSGAQSGLQIERQIVLL